MEDKKQVGLPPSIAPQLTQLREDTPYFGEESDVYRVAVAVALARRFRATDALKKSDFPAKFRAVRDDLPGGDVLPRLDSADRKLARMVELFFPEAVGEPYRNSQYLATMGINYLYGELVEKGRTLSQVITELADPPSSSAANVDELNE